MRNLTLAAALLLSLAFGLSAQGCLDNCGNFNPGTCGMCHTIQGGDKNVNPGGIWPPPDPECKDCGAQSDGISFKPIVPLSTKLDLMGLVESLRPTPDVKFARLAKMTPERHAELMEAALKGRRDGPMLGACTHAFHPGTLAQLPAAIAATRQRLLTARLIVIGR